MLKPICFQKADKHLFRNELKYVCTESELQQIAMRIQPLCPLDKHVAFQGTYQIRSVYFDDPQDNSLNQNEAGIDPREKFRIRIYNADTSYITLECKHKEHTMTRKESCRITYEQSLQIFSNKYYPKESAAPLLKRFAIEMHARRLQPKVIVLYERTPFIYSAGNVRITMDRNISSSSNIDAFFDPYIPSRPIMPVGKHVLEVKYDAFLPDYLYRIMNLGSLRQTAFSKYALCRKFAL